MAMSTRDAAGVLGIGSNPITGELHSSIVYSREQQGGSEDVGKAVWFDDSDGKWKLSDAESDDPVDGILKIVESDGYGTIDPEGYHAVPWNVTDGEPAIRDRIEGGQTAGTVRTDNVNGRHRVYDNYSTNHTGDCKAGEVIVHFAGFGA